MSCRFRAAFIEKAVPCLMQGTAFSGKRHRVLVCLCYSFLVKQMIRFASSKPAAR